jgi:hypothetical protein
LAAVTVVVVGNVVVFSSTLTLLIKLAVTMSGLPSPLRSAIAKPIGRVPAVRLMAAPKEPMPSPSRTLTPSELLPITWLAVTRSSLPSPLKSAIATLSFLGAPTAELVAAPKVGVVALGGVVFSNTLT